MQAALTRSCGWLLLAGLFWHGVAARLCAQGSGPVTVTATASAASPNVIPVGGTTAATLTAVATNLPVGGSGFSSMGSWAWTYTVQYADTPGQWGAPPAGAIYGVSVDPQPPSNPSTTMLRFSFSYPGYWQVTGLTATYTDPNQNITASGTAGDVLVTVVQVELSPPLIYVATGQTARPDVLVIPAGAASAVTFATADPGIAIFWGPAPDLSVTGAAVGSTQIQATLGPWLLASCEVVVLGVSYAPGSGPVLTEVDFTVTSSGSPLLSSATRITIQGFFEPEGFPDAGFAVAYEGADVRFDPAQPNQIALAVAEVFPGELLTSANPGLAMALTGTITGQATLSDGDWHCTVPVTFTITPSAFIGRLVKGTFTEVTESLPVWQAHSSQDLVGVKPARYLYAQIHRPVNAFTQGGANGPAQMLTAQLRSFYEDGKPVSSGVSAPFTLVASTGSFYVYQTPPFLLIDNPAYEGVQSGLLAVAGDNGASLQVVGLPP